MAASRRVILRAGSGSHALPGARPGRSEANVTSSSGALAIARRHDVTARLNGSVGASLEPVRNLELLVVMPQSPGDRTSSVFIMRKSFQPAATGSAQRHVDR